MAAKETEQAMKGRIVSVPVVCSKQPFERFPDRRPLTGLFLPLVEHNPNDRSGRHVCIRPAMPKVSNQILFRSVRCIRLVKIDESGWSLS